MVHKQKMFNTREKCIIRKLKSKSKRDTTLSTWIAISKSNMKGISLAVQWLELSTFTAVGLGQIPGLGSCLENSMHGGTWWATAHGVKRSRTRLSTHHCATALGTKIQEATWCGKNKRLCRGNYYTYLAFYRGSFLGSLFVANS